VCEGFHGFRLGLGNPTGGGGGGIIFLLWMTLLQRMTVDNDNANVHNLLNVTSCQY